VPQVTADTRSDRDLLAAHVVGDATAFEELVHRHRDRLWRVALRTLGDPEDAADAVQEGLLSAFRAAGGFRGDAAVTTWLHRIVVNACHDLSRRRRSRPTVAWGDRDVEAGDDPVSDRETGLTVLTALRRLPFEQAAALVLVDIEGFGVAEAAQLLDIPEGTVKSRCARGRARLVQLLADEGNGTAPPTVGPAVNGGGS
jgi:RNA polymerase sigma-70 factor (ECF subfamily)